METTYTKVCKKCLQERLITDFWINVQKKGGRSHQCADCLSEVRRFHWHHGNAKASIHKYEKTKKGFLMRLYRNMKSRVEGVQWQKAHLYKGMVLIDKETFYLWAINSNEFHGLFKIYEDSGHSRKLAPSVDRIDSSIGYEIDNMEWVTMSENSRRGSLSRRKVA